MRTLVTGGAGFIGSHLAELLLKRGHEVVIVDNLANGRENNLKGFRNHPKLSFEKIDILDREKLVPCFQDIDWVFHLAGIADIVPSIENPVKYFDVNVQGTLNVLESSRQWGVKRFVYAASSSSYGIPNKYPTPETALIQPQYPYALTKYMGEELVLHWADTYQLPAVSLRLFNVYGPRSRTSGTYGAVFGIFLAQKLKKQPFTVVGDGTQTRDFTYVTDIAEAFIAVALSNFSGGALNAGSGNHYSINRLVELLGGEVVHIPKRPGEPDCTFADVTRIQEILNWKPKVSFEEGVQKLLERLQDYEEAPLWDPDSIKNATQVWFKYLSKERSNA